jgi:predicted amidophosphoribosyltransferase
VIEEGNMGICKICGKKIAEVCRNCTQALKSKYRGKKGVEEAVERFEEWEKH